MSRNRPNIPVDSPLPAVAITNVRLDSSHAGSADSVWRMRPARTWIVSSRSVAAEESGKSRFTVTMGRLEAIRRLKPSAVVVFSEFVGPQINTSPVALSVTMSSAAAT